MDGLEAFANVVVGLAINWAVLILIIGVSPVIATGTSALMIGLSFLRSYALRKLFRRLQ